MDKDLNVLILNSIQIIYLKNKKINKKKYKLSTSTLKIIDEFDNLHTIRLNFNTPRLCASSLFKKVVDNLKVQHCADL